MTPRPAVTWAARCGAATAQKAAGLVAGHLLHRSRFRITALERSGRHGGAVAGFQLELVGPTPCDYKPHGQDELSEEGQP
ncbi:NAD(P)-binding protein [Paenirhodobacter populi]|uniref:Uncharacterized protein n=1 Tax=Paenirhodobacter populi TaxID=2306993 RepID=A0A443ISX4_9RHOB|nr:hypothetical protein D2T32_05980 [Sinirhodobacter populi]RWR10546.1 hypothetical protein D2T33_12900 [Sinirhodobacter populi]